MKEIIIISLVLALAGAIAVVVSIAVKYKRGLTSPIYPLEHYTRLRLTVKEDRFLNRFVTKVRVASSKNKR